MPEERLQKILSQAGVASRRQAEQIILEGRVAVNGQVITELGSKADIERDHIKVDGRLLHPPRRLVYIALNKPNNTVTTVSDPEGRATVMELLRGVRERVYPVGRLDYHSEGLLLLTNDGEIANAITSAATHLPKTYFVKANGTLSATQEQQFRDGIPLMGRRTMPAGLKLAREAQNPWYEVRLYEGRNNQIRLMFKHFGLLVEKLKRVRVGPLELGSLEPGQFRYLTEEEIHKLQRAVRRGGEAPRQTALASPPSRGDQTARPSPPPNRGQTARPSPPSNRGQAGRPSPPSNRRQIGRPSPPSNRRQTGHPSTPPTNRQTGRPSPPPNRSQTGHLSPPSNRRHRRKGGAV